MSLSVAFDSSCNSSSLCCQTKLSKSFGMKAFPSECGFPPWHLSCSFQGMIITVIAGQNEYWFQGISYGKYAVNIVKSCREVWRFRHKKRHPKDISNSQHAFVKMDGRCDALSYTSYSSQLSCKSHCFFYCSYFRQYDMTPMFWGISGGTLSFVLLDARKVQPTFNVKLSLVPFVLLRSSSAPPMTTATSAHGADRHS